MHHLFWVYRRRGSDESAAQAMVNNRREYQALRQLFQSRWPGLDLRTTPAEGAGVRLIIRVSRPAAAIERFLFECLVMRNAQEPSARLMLERSRRRSAARDGKSETREAQMETGTENDQQRSPVHPSGENQ